MTRLLRGAVGTAMLRTGTAMLLTLFGSPVAAELPLAGVGQLLVPGIRYEEGRRRHYNERCSATLVTAAPKGASRWLLTAWHCLEYYRDLSHDITFVHSSGERTTATAVASGGSMYADWALLRLARPLPDAVPLVEVRVKPGMSLVLAGYSSRPEDDPPPLELDLRCSVTAAEGRDLASDCHARHGASGGAVFSSIDEGGRYLGIVSRGDGGSHSIFVPLMRLAGALRPFLVIPPPPAGGPPARPQHDQS